MHLLRQYILFVLVVVFLLTLARAGYALWYFPLLGETQTITSVFVKGLRFDLALIGLICLIPTVIGTLFSILGVTKSLAKLIISVFFFGGFLLITLLELVTPWFLHTQGVRPDFSILASLDSPVGAVQEIFGQSPILLVSGIVVALVLLIAYWIRMDLKRFLRLRIGFFSGVLYAVFCAVLCIIAIWSTTDIRKAPLGIEDSVIVENETVNEIALNTTYKALTSIAAPHIESLHAAVLPLISQYLPEQEQESEQEPEQELEQESEQESEQELEQELDIEAQ